MSRTAALPHEKIRALAETLSARQVPHAFGGAIALLYCGEPRGTIDIDVNVFVAESEAASVFPLLESLGVSVDRTRALQAIQRDGQVRLDWAGTPLDLFFSYDPLHESCRARAREVDFLATRIAVLSAEDLVVFKVLFDRRKDWADIEQVLVAGRGSFDSGYVRSWLRRLIGPDDARSQSFEALLEETRST